MLNIWMVVVGICVLASVILGAVFIGRRHYDKGTPDDESANDKKKIKIYSEYVPLLTNMRTHAEKRNGKLVRVEGLLRAYWAEIDTTEKCQKMTYESYLKRSLNLFKMCYINFTISNIAFPRDLKLSLGRLSQVLYKNLSKSDVTNHLYQCAMNIRWNIGVTKAQVLSGNQDQKHWKQVCVLTGQTFAQRAVELGLESQVVIPERMRSEGDEKGFGIKIAH
ncbi:hypothetical protein MMH89_01880 [Candidatus Comchoanobacter bicostacola]|uniref:Uncharacterized protein n=1 Tax=Candidatus Comchoanobacter bicostacola TaxID=2919598 RepID=A0ABY5DK83_9GAMM|nr:hypothetical protein [Candidatus Comchoanobacter bicostacola]UTC24898.1 hypothetical protein MMH89_01880 [Candidatus Comchoanobacter bicostacola]